MGVTDAGAAATLSAARRTVGPAAHPKPQRKEKVTRHQQLPPG